MRIRETAMTIACGLLHYSGVNALLRLFYQARGRIPILMYHSICDADHLNSCLSLAGMVVRARTFRHQLDYLRKKYDVMSLKELVGYIEKGQRPPRRAVAITFDDGFIDNFTVVLPAMRDAGCTGTFFIIGDTLLRGGVIWPHALYELLDGLSRREEPTKKGNLSPGRTENGGSPEKMRVAGEIKRKAEGASPDSKTSILREICEANGYEFSSLVHEGKYLGIAEIERLREEGHLIGAHSMSHEKIGLMPDSRKKEEIERCKALVGKLADKDFFPFAYPFGGKDSFRDGDKRLLKENGFSCALTTIEGSNRVGSDLFQLKRIEIGDYGRAEFAVRVNGVVGDVKEILKKAIGRN